jgi:hypothetical protein
MPETLSPYRPTRAEQETIIRWDREDPLVHVFSASPVVWRKLARLGLEPTRRSTVRGAEAGRFYTVPLARLRWSVARERVEGQTKRTGNVAALARAREQRRATA